MPKHVHVYKDGKEVAKITVPNLRLLNGRMNKRLKKIIAQIKEELTKKKISKKHLARQLQTSDNQIHRLLNPNILNKNLTQLYKLASLLGLEFEIQIKAA